MEDILKQDLQVGDFVTMYRSSYTTEDTAFGIIYSLDNQVYTLHGILKENQVLKLPEKAIETGAYKEAYDKLCESYVNYIVKLRKEDDLFEELKSMTFIQTSNKQTPWVLLLGKLHMTIDIEAEGKTPVNIYHSGMLMIKPSQLIQNGLLFDKNGKVLTEVPDTQEAICDMMDKAAMFNTEAFLDGILRTRYLKMFKADAVFEAGENRTRLKIAHVSPSKLKLTKIGKTLPMTKELSSISGEHLYKGIKVTLQVGFENIDNEDKDAIINSEIRMGDCR